MKGGAAGGGYAQVVPMENINLHFTGDFHAIGSAHNLLAALIDNHIYWGNELDLDQRRIGWRRVVDMNDRALRSIVSSLGGVANGFPREDGFDITVASEVMAVFCLATDLADLERRLGRMVVGQTRERAAGDRGAAQGAGPDDRPSEGRADAEPGADAREQSGVHPRRAVRQHRPWLQLGHGDQARAQALRLRGHRGGLRRRPRRREVLRHQVPQGRPHARRRGDRRDHPRAQDARRRRPEGLGKENLEAVRKGLANLGRHVANVRKFGVPAVVAINHFTSDTDAEHTLVRDFCRDKFGIEAIVCSHWADGSAGTEALAEHVVSLLDGRPALDGRGFRHLYPDEMPLWDKVRTIATEIYGAEDIIADKRVRAQFQELPGPAASATSRSASPRPSTASRPTPTSRARRPATSCRSARSGSRAAPSSWS